MTEKVTLHHQLTDFLTNDKKSKKIIVSTLIELRNLYKGWGKEYGQLEGYIFNSVWNRKPNLSNPSTRKEKLSYVIRLGCGISSINQIPMSLITTDDFKTKNYLIKDRGHILHTSCTTYNDTIWNVYETQQALKSLSNDIRGGVKESQFTTNDSDKKEALGIIKDIQTYLNTLIEKQKEVEPTKSKSDMKLSISKICDNVSSFNENLNNTEISIEIARESVYTHIREIEYLNNYTNKWKDVQLGFLSFWANCFNTDNNSSYLDSELKYESLSNWISAQKFWSFKHSDDFPILSEDMKRNSVIGESAISFVPLHILGWAHSGKSIKEFTSSEMNPTNSKKYSAIFDNLHKDNVTFEDAKDELKLYGSIAMSYRWKEFETKRKELFDTEYKVTDLNTDNLVHTNIKHSSFGGVCILACADLIKSRCDKQEDRTNPSIIESWVGKFTDALYSKLVEICDDRTYFSDTSRDAVSRFEALILPVYEELSQIKTDEALSDKQIRQYHLNELVTEYGSKELFSNYEVLKLTNKTYDGKLEISTLDFEEAVNNPNIANIDLGQKIAGKEYTIENTFLQSKYENRSNNKVNHMYSNSIEYWKWFSEENLTLVTKHRNELMNMNQLAVIVYADKLYKLFHKK